MLYRLSADSVLIVHFCFVLFIIFGGLLVLRRRWMMWLHLPAVAWGVLIEYFRWICPLTTIEDFLRSLGGETGYGEGGFIEYYISAILYPSITPLVQYALIFILIAVNVGIYAYVFRRRLNL